MATSLRSVSGLRSGLVALLMAGGACADDTPALPTTSDSETEQGTSTTETPTTTPNPDSTTTVDDTRGESSTTDGMTTLPETTTTDGDAECGNGTIEDGEDCESEDLGGEDCASQGFVGGTLSCTKDCTFDTSMCTEGECGNGTIEGKEACDTDDLGDATCLTEGFDGGELACADDCTLDSTGCVSFMCGNEVIEGKEVCDGPDLAGEGCASQGFLSGTLACAADCMAFDTADCTQCAHDVCLPGVALTVDCGDPCVNTICAEDPFCCETEWDDQCINEVDTICGLACDPPTCGNEIWEFLEDCDGADLGGEDCVSQGFAGGVLACADDCTLDTSACTAPPCAHALCEVGVALDPACDPCVATICGEDAFCCNEEWDVLCFNRVGTDCGMPCPVVCGNGVLQAGEACDGEVLDDETCVTQGFPGGGVLACQGDCTAFDTTACVAGPDLSCSEENVAVTGSPVTSGSTAAEDNDLDASCGGTGGNDRVITFTAPANGVYVFSTAGSGFDTKLALFTSCDAGTQVACNDDFNATPQSQVNRYMNAGDSILVVVDGYNGATGNWNLNISTLGGGGLACVEQDIGGSTGAAVASGTTVGGDSDLNPSCGGTGGPDWVVQFTASEEGNHTFDTFGSGYDTKLALYVDCAAGSQLVCNDDAAATPQSSVTQFLGNGQTVLVVVDGYNGATGNWTLNVTPP